MVQVFNPSTEEEEAGEAREFKASLVYLVSSWPVSSKIINK